ncbi:RHS repeat domain-containing protein [Microbacterium oleivorans]|nr:RHS repeat-associated core domain-containing protein [Microbacterium oleivorans]
MSAVSVGLLSAALLVGVAVPAYAALPAGPVTVGVTGARPGATEIPFQISDQVGVGVDVATGNLRVSTRSLSLVGVTGQVGIGQTYNSLSNLAGASNAGAANRWVFSAQGAGFLATSYGGGGLTYTAGDGSTWKYTTGTGSAFTSPAGAKADLVSITGGYKLTDRQSRQVVTFDTDGRATSIADRNGNTTTLTYDPYGTVSTVVSSAGPTAARTATFAYSSTTRTLTASQTSGVLSRSVKWVKDASQNLTSIVDGENKTTSFGYTGQQLTSITGPTGAVVTIGYESSTSSRVVSVSQANTTAGSSGTSVTRISYPSSTSRNLARPNTDQASSVASVPHITYTINSTTRLVTKSVDEMGREKAKTYTPNGDTATATSGAGSTAGTTTATYGANGGDSLTSLQAPGGQTSSQAFSNTAASTQYLASSSTDSAGNSSTYTYNGSGNQLTSTDANAATATLTYNTDGTVATALAAGNGSNKTLYGYNANRQLTSMTPVTGSSLGARAFTYDDFGRLKTATDGRGTTTTYTYDKQDRLLTTSFSDGTATVTNTYTDRGLPATRVDGNGTTTYGYDQLGRLISRGNTFNGGTITYGYDKSSNLTSTTDSRGTTTYAFDTAGVPTSMTYPDGTGSDLMNFAVDDQGRRTDTWLRTNADNSQWTAHTQQEYDTSGRVSRAIAKSVNSAGEIVTVQDVTYCYNTGSAAPTCGTGTSGDRAKLHWQLDNLTGQSTTYGYDTSGRLTSATQAGGTNPTTWTYTYDARGNRLTSNATGGTTTSQTLTFNAANQVTTTGHTYDGTGNLTADTAGTYTYNGAQQMTGVSNASGSFTYKYAGTSQVEVLQQQQASVTRKLTYGRTNQAGLPVLEQAQWGSITAYIENDPVTGQPLLLRTSTNTVSLYVYDGLGNPTAILRDFGSPGYTYTYDPFGLPTLTYNSGGTGQTQNPFLFKGGIQDRATGWVHFGNRWYNPTLGRWTQQDTLDAPLDPANANRYAYAGCDPINNADPTGLNCSKAIGDLVASGVGLASSVVGIVLSTAAVIPSGGVSLTLGVASALGYSAAAYSTISAIGSVISDCG